MSPAMTVHVLEMLWERAADDNVDDLDRLLMQMGAMAIEQMQDRCLHLAREIETHGGHGL